MRKRKPAFIVAVHLVTLVTAIALALVSGENPRVLLYAHAISLLVFMLVVWFLAIRVNRPGIHTILLPRVTREPGPHDRSRPYFKDDKGREPAGILNYVVGILSLWVMLGVLLLLASGTAFLSPELFVPELLWATLLAAVFVVSDLAQRRIVLDSRAEVSVNLGYNASEISILSAAIFISGFAFLMAGIAFTALATESGPRSGAAIEWTVFVALSLVRTGLEISRDLKKQKGSFRMMSHRAGLD